MSEVKEATRPKPSRARLLPLEPRPARPNRALLVDDGSAGYEIYVQRLRDEGYEVTRASDPASAVEVAQHWEPNLIFVPGPSGRGRDPVPVGQAVDHVGQLVADGPDVHQAQLHAPQRRLPPGQHPHLDQHLLQHRDDDAIDAPPVSGRFAIVHAPVMRPPA